MAGKKTMHALAVSLALSLGLGSLMGSWATAQETQQTQAEFSLDENQALLDYEQNTIAIVERYSPSVVSITVTVAGQTVSPEGLDQFLEQVPPEFQEFFDLPQGQEMPPQQGSGSGFVVDDQGRIITNYHVVAAALEEGDVALREGASVSVTFPSSDEEYPARVVGANALYDLALLEISDPDALPQEVREVVPIPIASTDEVRVGQKAVAIGNPFGFATTVTEGIVSGISRSLPGVGQIDVPLIQTDAPINPGNSGGPLLNSRGQLIGVNTAIIPGFGLGGQRGNVGIGFAVPATVLAENLAQLEEGGFTDLRSRARLGVSITDVQAYPENVRRSLGLPDAGVVILQVEPGGAAEAAGLQGGSFEVNVNGQTVPAGGDVILAVDGTDVTSTSQLQNLILSRQEGDTVELRIWRNGEEQTVEVVLARVPQAQQGDEQNGQEQDDEGEGDSGGGN